MATLSGLRHFEGRARPLGTVVNGQATVVFLARDITERVEAESALRESELRFRSLLRDIPSISVQGYLARRHHHLLEQGVGSAVRLHRTGSPGQATCWS
jgi:PAS domain-containing protein